MKMNIYSVIISYFETKFKFISGNKTFIKTAIKNIAILSVILSEYTEIYLILPL